MIGEGGELRRLEEPPQETKSMFAESFESLALIECCVGLQPIVVKFVFHLWSPCSSKAGKVSQQLFDSLGSASARAPACVCWKRKNCETSFKDMFAQNW